MNRTISLVLLLSCCANAAAGGGRVFTAARHIRAGEEIRAEALVITEAPAGAEALEPGDLAGTEAVRPIRAGEKITRLMVRPVRAVRAGEKIRVSMSVGRVRVSAWFVALQGGATGETIEARNQKSGKTCGVVVAGPGEGVLKEGDR